MSNEQQERDLKILNIFNAMADRSGTVTDEELNALYETARENMPKDKK